MFFDLTSRDDSVTFRPRELLNFSQGVRGLWGNDYLSGSSDSESMNGNQGNDTLRGNFGSDYLLGGKGDDNIDGEGDNDTINGNMGNDIVRGGDGFDIVRGGNGDDRIFGDNGNDTLIGDLGADTLTGGNGSDVFVFRNDNLTTALERVNIVTDFKISDGDFLGFDARTDLTKVVLDDSQSYFGTGAVDTVVRLFNSDRIYAVLVDTPARDIALRMFIVPDSFLFEIG